MKFKTIEVLVSLFGGAITGGINWTWASFPTATGAHAFHTAITSDPTIETRGVYEPSKHNKHTWGVRFR